MEGERYKAASVQLLLLSLVEQRAGDAEYVRRLAAAARLIGRLASAGRVRRGSEFDVALVAADVAWGSDRDPVSGLRVPCAVTKAQAMGSRRGCGRATAPQSESAGAAVPAYGCEPGVGSGSSPPSRGTRWRPCATTFAPKGAGRSRSSPALRSKSRALQRSWVS